MSESERLLRELVAALDGAFISSWQSTAAWANQLDAANIHIQKLDEQGAKQNG